MKKVTVKKKAEKKPLHQQVKKVKASARCGNFNIDIWAELEPKGLTVSDIDDIQRKLRNSLTRAIAALPMSNMYPCEVKTR